MTHAYTARIIATLTIAVAAFGAPTITTDGQLLGSPAPKPPIAEIVPVEPAAAEPVIYAMPEDEIVYANTLALFADRGFTAPEFIARFHTSTDQCKGHRGLHVLTSAGVSTVNVCATHDNPLVLETVRERTLMHEVAHVWIEQNVSPKQKAAFMELRGPTVWEGNGAAWAHLGAEHAAEILLWGMTDETRNITFGIDKSDVENLRAAYRILISGTVLSRSPATYS